MEIPADPSIYIYHASTMVCATAEMGLTSLGGWSDAEFYPKDVSIVSVTHPCLYFEVYS